MLLFKNNTPGGSNYELVLALYVVMMSCFTLECWMCEVGTKHRLLNEIGSFICSVRTCKADKKLL